MKVLRSLLPNWMPFVTLKNLLKVCSAPEMGMNVLLPGSQFLPDCRRIFLECSTRRLVLVSRRRGRSAFDRSNSRTLRPEGCMCRCRFEHFKARLAESSVERGVEGRQVLGSCQAGEAGYSEE